MKDRSQVRTYKATECIVVHKTKDKYGGLSNMAAGFPLEIHGVRILTSEALYQACRFTHKPEIQRIIIQQNSPMTAKMKSKHFLKETRGDWQKKRIQVMRWCLRVKLAQNWRKFSDLLLTTGDRSIVEQSIKDDFWGANKINKDTLVGMNVLGRLLMELREELRTTDADRLMLVKPLDIPQFRLYEKPIGAVGSIAREHTSKEPVYGLFLGGLILNTIHNIINRTVQVGKTLPLPAEGDESPLRDWLKSRLLVEALGWPDGSVKIGERFDILLLDEFDHPVAIIETKAPFHLSTKTEQEKFRGRLHYLPTLRVAFFTNGLKWDRLDLISINGQQKINNEISLDLSQTNAELAECFFLPLRGDHYFRWGKRNRSRVT